MLKATKVLLKPAEIRMIKAKAVFMISWMATNQGAHARFVKRQNAVIMLRIPRNARCGGKLVNGKDIRRISPVTAKNAMDANSVGLKVFSLVDRDTVVRLYLMQYGFN